MSIVVSSFSDLREAWNSSHDHANRVKMPKVKGESRKCKKCGNQMRNVPGTNVWMCDFVNLEDAKLPNGKDAQVFTKCGNILLDKEK